MGRNAKRNESKEKPRRKNVRKNAKKNEKEKKSGKRNVKKKKKSKENERDPVRQKGRKQRKPKAKRRRRAVVVRTPVKRREIFRSNKLTSLLSGVGSRSSNRRF